MEQVRRLVWGTRVTGKMGSAAACREVGLIGKVC